MPVLESWSRELSHAIAQTLTALQLNFTDRGVSMLALDCHPWNGGLYLAILKRSEVWADPELFDPAEMAAWEMYDCGESVDEWKPVAVLAAQMRNRYSQADDPSAIADEYFRACAKALTEKQVRAAIQPFGLDDRFRLSVAHPDDGREFCDA